MLRFEPKTEGISPSGRAVSACILAHAKSEVANFSQKLIVNVACWSRFRNRNFPLIVFSLILIFIVFFAYRNLIWRNSKTQSDAERSCRMSQMSPSRSTSMAESSPATPRAVGRRDINDFSDFPAQRRGEVFSFQHVIEGHPLRFDAEATALVKPADASPDEIQWRFACRLIMARRVAVSVFGFSSSTLRWSRSQQKWRSD